MRYKGGIFRSYRFAVLLVMLVLLVGSCKKDKQEDDTGQLVKPVFKSFTFKNKVNSLVLVEDLSCTIDGQLISARIPYVMQSLKLVPTFEFEGSKVLINGKVQESGKDTVDFSVPVQYSLVGPMGEISSYTVSITVFTGLPVIDIFTEYSTPVTSKDEYLEAHFQLRENSRLSVSNEIDIKGHGNTTWGMPKKPYKLRFESKTALLGMPADKEWLLLANYADKTALRNETAFQMGRLSNLAWTPNTRYVEVFINNVYSGVYQLCEQIKIATSRVNVTDNGYLLEVDQPERLETDDIYFRTPRLLFVIKDPDVEQNSERYKWISDYVNTAEELLYEGNFDESSGYSKYMDLTSFADWFLINEISKNNDAIMFTSCYLNLSPNGKLKMGPIWDFDIAFGNINYNNNQNPEGWWVANALWFNQMLKDPVFINLVKERFAYFKSHSDDLFISINANATYLKWSVIENNNVWRTLYTETWPNYAITGNYNNEIQYMKAWINARLIWLDQAINSL